MSSVKDMAKDLVIRSRLGDQNATAILQLMAANARKGVPKAIRARAEVQAYINANPVGKMAGEPTTSSNRQNEYFGVCVALANGPPITVGHVLATASQFGGDESLERKLFSFGFLHFQRPSWLMTVAQKISGASIYLRTGAAMAYARAVQRVRHPKAPISVLSPSAGWEMGE